MRWSARYAAAAQWPHGRTNRGHGQRQGRTQFRMQFAERYPTEDELSTASRQFVSWNQARASLPKPGPMAPKPTPKPFHERVQIGVVVDCRYQNIIAPRQPGAAVQSVLADGLLSPANHGHPSLRATSASQPTKGIGARSPEPGENKLERLFKRATYKRISI